jgi:hypothetical protein
MHPCLCIPEILTAIFEEVKNACDNERELHALTTTCKAFSGPAVAILWRTLLNPVFLLLTMPNDLWELEEIPWIPRDDNDDDDSDDDSDEHVHQFQSKLLVSHVYSSLGC